MKVLICHRPGGAFGYISDGWLNALRSKGHKAERWDGKEESWFGFEPDLYIGCSGHRQPIPSKNSAKIAIHVNPYGPTDIGGISEPEDARQWVVKQKPNAVFGYGFEDDRILWRYWTEKLGIEWVPMPTAGDKTIYVKTDAPKLNDIVYLGGRWQYKGLTIDAYLIPILSQFSYKLYGWGDWPHNICSGILPDDKVAAFLGSGKIGPCISERHTHEYGIDLPERAFKVALCGTLFIHDGVPGLKKQISSAIVASNPTQFRDYCEYYLKHEDERLERAEQQRSEVLLNHTYHHRMAKLFSVLGFADEATAMIM